MLQTHSVSIHWHVPLRSPCLVYLMYVCISICASWGGTCYDMLCSDGQTHMLEKLNRFIVNKKMCVSATSSESLLKIRFIYGQQLHSAVVQRCVEIHS